MKQLYTLLLITLLSQTSHAQKVLFIYNEAGLRVKRGTEAALPVTLVQFTVEKMERESGITALLRWETSSEMNSDRFEVERSGDGKIWAALSSITAQGDSEIGAKYQFEDEAPLAGDNYYRLKMIDRDGTFAFSQVRHLNMEMLLSIYPNPVEDRLYIQEPGADLVQIYNVAGQLVTERRGDISSGIDVAKLPTGSYVLKFIAAGKAQLVRKFVKK